MTVARTMVLFVLAALAEIGGAWLVWQGVREHRGWIWIGAGVVRDVVWDTRFGRLGVGKARFRKLVIDDLVVRHWRTPGRL